MHDTSDSSNKTVRAVSRALDILEALGQTEEGTGLVDLASAVNLTHPTVYRLLKTMEGKAFVAQDAGSSRYYLSKKILQMQATTATERRLIWLAIPRLTELAEQLRGAAHLAALGEDRVVYLESRRSEPYLREHLPSGRTVPIYCSGLGKVLAAFLPTEQLEALVERISFEARTPRTITDPIAFLKCLEQVRNSGFAVDDEELSMGVHCVAAPVRSHGGNVVAAMSVALFAGRFRADRVPETADIVIRAAEDVSRDFGWNDRSTINGGREHQ